MNLKELALQLSAITVIADLAKETKDRLRAEFAEALNAVGADSAKAIFDGVDVAKVSLIQPKPTPNVLSEKVFTDWVKSHWESEVVESVRETFRKSLLSKCEFIDGKAIYPETGEVLDFLAFESRESYVSTKFATAGRVAIMDAFKTGVLTPTTVMAKELLESYSQ